MEFPAATGRAGRFYNYAEHISEPPPQRPGFDRPPINRRRLRVKRARCIDSHWRSQATDEWKSDGNGQASEESVRRLLSQGRCLLWASLDLSLSGRQVKGPSR